MSLKRLPSTQIDIAVDTLARGGLVVYPTDTVYGLGAYAYLEEAVARVYQVKGRAQDKPFPLLVAEAADMERLAMISPLAWRLAERFLPGGLTLILPSLPTTPLWLTSGGTIALRVPNHPVPRALSRGLEAPIIGTSANRSGGPEPTTLEEALAQVGNGVDAAIDGGRSPGGVPSTVLDLSGPRPVILREGAVPRQAIEEIVGAST